jgi:hydroxymethylbilane synthase
MTKKIVLGTRGSELALAQARMVIEQLKERWAGLTIKTKIIKTRGDDREIAIEDLRAGRKGLFTGEIERALLAHDVDLAVHSAKDLPSSLATGTQIAAVLPRAPVDDVLVSIVPFKLESLPRNGIVATGSVRRQHQLRWQRPDLEIVDLRGNVPTRLEKLVGERWHAIILARAGVERLGMNLAQPRFAFDGKEFSAELLPQEFFLPAGGQGVIAIQSRGDDDNLKMLLEEINDWDTRLCLRAEREFLRLLDADCNQPVGVLATPAGSIMTMRAQIFDVEATTPRTAKVEGHCEDAEKLAAELFAKINAR